MQYRLILLIGSMVATAVACTTFTGEQKSSWNQPATSQQTVEPSPGQTRPNLLTPEGAMRRYINSLRQGNIEEIKTVIYPPTLDFSLPEPIPIESYQIVKKTVLNAGDLEALDFRPIPQVGDVRFDVWSQVTNQCDRMHSYFLREIDGRWKIYTWFAWGVDS